jgi:hypothetical protein
MSSHRSHLAVRAIAVAVVLAADMTWAAESPTPSMATTTTTLADGHAAKGSEQDACRLLPRIASGDLSGLEPLPAQKDPAFGGALTDYLSCLAIAKSSRSYCDLLPKAEKSACILRSQTVENLKTPTKEKSVATTMAPLLDQECRRQTTKAECDQLQEALVTRDVAKCNGLPHLANPCEAIVTGDPKHCGEDMRCKELIANFTTLQQAGMSGLTSRGTPDLLDSLLAAAHDGERACAPLRQALQPACGEVAK